MNFTIQIVSLIVLGSILDSINIKPFSGHYLEFWGIIALTIISNFTSYSRGLSYGLAKAEEYMEEFETFGE